jgi:hypothetical protein
MSVGKTRNVLITLGGRALDKGFITCDEANAMMTDKSVVTDIKRFAWYLNLLSCRGFNFKIERDGITLVESKDKLLSVKSRTLSRAFIAVWKDEKTNPTQDKEIGDIHGLLYRLKWEYYLMRLYLGSLEKITLDKIKFVDDWICPSHTYWIELGYWLNPSIIRSMNMSHETKMSPDEI